MLARARVRVFIVSLCFRNCTGDSVISLDDIWRQTSISTVLNISSSGHCVFYDSRNMHRVRFGFKFRFNFVLDNNNNNNNNVEQDGNPSCSNKIVRICTISFTRAFSTHDQRGGRRGRWWRVEKQRVMIW